MPVCVEILIVHYEAGWDLQPILDGLKQAHTPKINKQSSISHEENFLEINSERAGGRDIKRQRPEWKARARS